MGIILNRRRVYGGSALPYDAEIEYLESQGNCIIPTDAIPTGTNITIKTKIYYIGYTTNGQWISWFSAYTNENSPSYRIIRTGASYDQILVYNSGRASGGGTAYSLYPYSLGNIEMYPRYCIINGSRNSLKSLATPVNTGAMNIFSPQFKGRFYSFYMADGDNILLDLIPVRKVGVGYMYDKVSGQLFGNAGTGEFILGPDVNSKIIITPNQQRQMYG